MLADVEENLISSGESVTITFDILITREAFVAVTLGNKTFDQKLPAHSTFLSKQVPTCFKIGWHQF